MLLILVAEPQGSAVRQGVVLSAGAALEPALEVSVTGGFNELQPLKL